MLQGFAGKFGEFLSKLIGRKNVTILKDTQLQTSLTLTDDELRAELKQELNEYYRTETLTREYNFVSLVKTRIYTNPELIVLGKNEQLVARVIMVGIDGKKYELDIHFKIGEKFTLDVYYSKIAGKFDYTPVNNLTRSQYVRMAVVEQNFYVQTWRSKG